MDARSPPNDRPPTPWLSGSSRSSRAPLLSPYSPMPSPYTALCTYMLTYVLTGRKRAPSFGLWGVGTWPTLRGRRTREGQELYELVVGGDTGEEFGGLTELVLFPAFRADDVGFDLLQFLVECFVEEVFRHLGAVFEDTSRVVDPLPHLGAADLRRRRVLHQVEDGYRAASSEPGREVLHTDRDVVSEAVHGDLALGLLQQVFRGGAHIGDLVELVGLGHVLIEDLFGERDHTGMGDPGPVVAVLRLALLIFSNLVVGELGPFGVVAAWDLGRHTPHRVGAALVAGLDGEQRVSAHERDRHGHRVAVREEHVMFAELLDIGEDIVPPAAV